jgi:hypothetical protein
MFYLMTAHDMTARVMSARDMSAHLTDFPQGVWVPFFCTQLPCNQTQSDRRIAVAYRFNENHAVAYRET